ncbi:hypothetical protein R3P38DRAFT_1879990 [Favolaschia claudopus]|uniref:Uncharacterized protein n=1 Tax=Favolaschia claudopus TaxID=2862362 RepID=A0AAW0D8I9_9AGAR
MRFTLTSTFAALATLTTVIAQSCSEAGRFGLPSVSPSTLSPGQTFTVTTNLTCAIEKGNTPTYLDYYISASATHKTSGPILLARRTWDKSSPPIDTFTTTLPNWFYFDDATYTLNLQNSFEREGPTGEKVITAGGIETPITITGIN